MIMHARRSNVVMITRGRRGMGQVDCSSSGSGWYTQHDAALAAAGPGCNAGTMTPAQLAACVQTQQNAAATFQNAWQACLQANQGQTAQQPPAQLPQGQPAPPEPNPPAPIPPEVVNPSPPSQPSASSTTGANWQSAVNQANGRMGNWWSGGPGGGLYSTVGGYLGTGTTAATSDLISGVPNWALFGGAVLVLMMMARK